MWVKYHEVKSRGVADEELHGIFVWQLKNLSLVSQSSQKDSGLKPFVYNKSKSALSKWGEKEPEQKLKQLIKNYHETRRGNLNFSLSLEQFILSL